MSTFHETSKAPRLHLQNMQKLPENALVQHFVLQMQKKTELFNLEATTLYVQRQSTSLPKNLLKLPKKQGKGEKSVLSRELQAP
jgi:hypothetical protein